ncbi:TRAP transporter small permease [Phreatobacter sp.]|uniref:TRAP transporter small permease n=1 Tax=Phreatobacter sp. TaxID=1966341 RepID=UPI003F72868F
MATESDPAILDDRSATPLGPLGGFVNVVAAIGTTWTFLLMFLIVADVIGRSFLSRPITGVAEIAAHSIVAIVFIQLAATVHARRLTRADVMIDAVRLRAPRFGHLMEALFLIVGLAVMALIAWSGWKPLMDALRASEFFGVQGLFTIPTWPFRATIVFGATLSAIVFAVQIVAELRQAGAASPRR